MINHDSKTKKTKSVFMEGPIPAAFIAESIQKHQIKHGIGAHDIFLGQVRADEINQSKVIAIDYSCYIEMADKEMLRIREEAFAKFNLICLHIYHSLHEVKVGEICLFVFTSSRHRKDAFEATRFIVEQIKKQVPIFGKEVLDNSSHQWKKNEE